MEIDERMLVLVKSGLPKKALAIVQKRLDASTWEVMLVSPLEVRGLKPLVDEAALMPIAKDIDLADLTMKMVPIIHKLAEDSFQFDLLLGVSTGIVEEFVKIPR